MYNLVVPAHKSLALFGVMPPGFPPSHPESFEAIGKRIRALRDALDMSQDELGASIGNPNGSALFSPIERGKDRIGLDTALALCRRYGITLDWVYRGLWHIGIPFDLAERIRAEEIKAEPKRR